MSDVDWLSEWIGPIRAAMDDGPLLELGCGAGRDARVLVDAGFSVIGVDIAMNALKSSGAIGNCLPVQTDLRQRLPFPDSAFNVVLASLCLHYFPWAQTLEVMDEIARVSRVPGMLLVRVNSTEDVNHGAGHGDLLEENFYRTGERTKRFFTEGDARKLLAGFDIEMLRHRSIDRYEKTKKVWEARATLRSK